MRRGWMALGALALVACSASGEEREPASTGSGGSDGGTTTTSGGGGAGDVGGAGVGGGFSSGPGGGGGGVPAAGEVYGHSDTQLFKLEPISNEVSFVGTFDCVAIALPGAGEGMWDIALDADSNMLGTVMQLVNFAQSGALVQIDKANAHCTVIAAGIYPNSLTFVPAGTLDPLEEVLVGFNLASYVRIDRTTGVQTPIGSLNPNPTGQDWESSGDVVSIIGAKTYLTVKPAGSGSGYNGPDTVVEIDPLNGQALAIIGDTGYPKLWGLGYWGGTAYGFSATGQLTAIDLSDGSATGIPIPNAPQGLAWWGAGVTTSAPIAPPN